MKCNNCGIEIQEPANFCPRCGKAVIQLPVTRNHEFNNNPYIKANQTVYQGQRRFTYCSVCGSTVEEKQPYCPVCGNKNVKSTQAKKRKVKKIVSGLSIAVSVILAVCIVINIVLGILPKRVDMDIKYEPREIEEFMETVCENADVESAEVEDVGYAGFGVDYGTYYAATLTVKLDGKVSEEIYVRFYNSEDRDDVSSIIVYYYEDDSKNEIACKDAIVEALELSFCGESIAKEYTDKFNSVGTYLYGEEQEITNYALTREAKVRISCYGHFGNDWSGKYCIYKN